MKLRVRESIARTIAISILYALVEAYFSPEHQGNVISPYHVIVFLISLIAGFDRNIKITIANALNYSVLEDALYWVFKGQLPFQWASEYIVIDHVPLYYFPFLTLALLLYKKGFRDDKARVQS